jgi:ribosome recycling factor
MYKYIVSDYPEDPVPHINKERTSTFNPEHHKSIYISVFDTFEEARDAVVNSLKAVAEAKLKAAEEAKSWTEDEVYDFYEEGD